MKKITLSIITCALLAGSLCAAHRDDIPSIPVGATPDTNASYWLPGKQIAGQVSVNDLTATASGTTVSFAWTPSLNTKTQAIWVYSGGSWSIITGAETLAYTTTSFSATLAAGNYYFEIVTTDSNNKTWNGNMVSTTVTAPVVNTPSGGGGTTTTTPTPTPTAETPVIVTPKPTPTPTSTPVDETIINIPRPSDGTGTTVTTTVTPVKDIQTGGTLQLPTDKPLTFTNTPTTTSDGKTTLNLDIKTTTGTTKNTEIKTDIPKENMTVTQTTTGVETRANTVSLDGTRQQIDTKVNTNGSMINTVTVTNTDGTTSSTKVISTKLGTNVEITKEGATKTSFSETTNGIKQEVSVEVNPKGETSHKVETIDSTGKTVETKASSNVPGTQVTIKEDGTVQTYAHTTTQIKDTITGVTSTSQVAVVIEGEVGGKAKHVVQVTDSTGTTISTQASSDIIGAQTTVTKSGSVNTQVVLNGENISVQANPDGSASHKVSFTGSDGKPVETTATSKIQGAQTNINSDGKLVTSVTKTVSGKKLTAIVETAYNGESITRYELTDLATGAKTLIDDTLDAATPFEKNNSVVVTQNAKGEPEITARTNVTRPIKFK